MSEVIMDVEIRDAKEKALSVMGAEYKEKNDTKNKLDKEVKALNAKIKDAMGELGISDFADGNIAIKISETDKSTLDEPKVIEYLKKNKLDIFVHTKEYIDMDEILYQAQNGKIPLKDLEPFVVKNVSYSLRIK